MKKKLIPFVLASLIVVLALAGCDAASEPSAVVRNYFNAINNNDTAAFLKCIDPDKAKMLEEQIEALNIDASKKSHIGKVMTGMDDADTLLFKILDEEVGEDTANVTVEITLTRADETTTDTIEVPVVKIDGKWYVRLW